MEDVRWGQKCGEEREVAGRWGSKGTNRQSRGNVGKTYNVPGSIYECERLTSSWCQTCPYVEHPQMVAYVHRSPMRYVLS